MQSAPCLCPASHAAATRHRSLAHHRPACPNQGRRSCPCSSQECSPPCTASGRRLQQAVGEALHGRSYDVGTRTAAACSRCFAWSNPSRTAVFCARHLVDASAEAHIQALWRAPAPALVADAADAAGLAVARDYGRRRQAAGMSTPGVRRAVWITSPASQRPPVPLTSDLWLRLRGRDALAPRAGLASGALGATTPCGARDGSEWDARQSIRAAASPIPTPALHERTAGVCTGFEVDAGATAAAGHDASTGHVTGACNEEGRRHVTSWSVL